MAKRKKKRFLRNGKKIIGGLTLGTLLAVLGIFFFISGRLISWVHWYAIEFNLLSYSPFLVPISWGAWVMYAIMTYIKKPHWYFYAMAIVWFISEVIWTYGMLKTWGWVF